MAREKMVGNLKVRNGKIEEYLWIHWRYGKTGG